MRSITYFLIVPIVFLFCEKNKFEPEFWDPYFLEPVYPSDNSKLGFTIYRENKLVFWWQESSKGVNYRIQISKDKSFNSTIINEITKHNFYEWKNIPEGSYFWRLKTIMDNQEGIFSSPKFFTYQITPDLIYPPDGSNLTSVFIEFRWSKIEGASRYILEVRRKGDSSLVLYYISEENTAYWDNIQQGDYIWRVRAVADSIYGPFSEYYNLQVSTQTKSY